MTLEDFFTLSEMKDGLGTLARIEELISVMQEQKDNVLNNVADAIRQWSTVASIISATESKDCLERFIQLNGLCFLNQWLQEAKKHSFDGGDGSVGKLVSALLGALQRLPINREISISSGIGISLKEILDHGNHIFLEKGRILLDKWNFLRIDDIRGHDLQKGGLRSDGEKKVSTSTTEEDVQSGHARNISTEEVMGEGVNRIKFAKNDAANLNAKILQVSSEAGTNNVVKVSQQIPETAAISGEAAAISGDMNSLTSSHVSNPCQESVSITEESSICPTTGMASTGACSSTFTQKRIIDDQPDLSHIKVTSDNAKEIELTMEIKDNSSCKSTQKEDCIVSSSSGTSYSPLQTQNSTTVSSAVCNFDSKKSECSMIKTTEPQLNSSLVECGLAKKLRTRKDFKTAGRHSSSGKFKVLETSVKSLGEQHASDIKEIRSSNIKVSKGLGSRSQPVSLEQATGTTNESDRRSSHAGLEYGDDALEFAVRVAIEAKREVADREQCSSSQGGHSEGEIMDSGSLELQENAVVQSLSCVSPPILDNSDSGSLPSENSSRTSENIDTDRKEQHFHKPESLKSNSIVQESPVKIVRCNFDLNEGVGSEDVDHYSPVPIPHQQNLSAPIAVIATSKGTSMLPISPPYFEGELGWKGSAATSAFRPASSRKTPESEKIVSNNMLKTVSLEIDLNIAEGDDDVAVDPELERHAPSSGLPFGNCSVEGGSEKAERLNLDLNQLGDEDAFPNSSCWRLHHQNGNHSSSPASSSSAKRLSLRDFDLNDSPPTFDAWSPQNKTMPYTKDAGTSGSGDSDVMVLGSRMSTTTREHINQGHRHFSGNSPHMESTMVTGPSVFYPYMPAHGYGFDGVAVGPATLSLHPGFYGPGSFPYIVDSRGAAIMPQVPGSSTGFIDHQTARPFLVSAAGSSLGSGTAENSRPTLDLNSGLLSLDSGSREFGNFGKLFVQGHSGLTEHKMSASHSTPGSAVSLKRKEPESGWERHPIGYKKMAPWH